MNRSDKLTVTACITALVCILIAIVLMGASLSASAQVPIYTRPAATSVTAATIATAESGEDSITAFATGGQTSATALSATVTHHRVSTVATAGDSVKLPAATVGQAHFLRNDGAAAMQVFGQATETINGVASATGISQAVGMGVWYICTTAGNWTTTPVTFFRADGVVGAPAYSFASETNTGIYRAGSGSVDVSIAGTRSFIFNNTGLFLATNSTALVLGASGDISLSRAAANSVMFNGANTPVTTTSRTELNKAVASIADAAATAVLTVTIPNAAHSGSMLVRLTCSLGAGGAIGANEATATNTYIVAFTRTPGVNATAAISAAFGAAATAVAGAATVTATAAMSAVSGAVGATNTFTVNATVTRSGGSSTNHTCLVYAQLMNANATGITIS